MKLQQLEILCKIIELGSFSKAADVLHLSQPTLTEHIKSLEKHLDIPLLDRLGREVSPTKAGRMLYDDALKILELAKQAEQKIKSLQGDLRGDLTVGASTIPGEFILPNLMKRFYEQFPGIIIHVNISDSKKVIEEVSGNRLELGIVGTKLESPKLTYHTFLSDELVLIAPAHAHWIKEQPVLVSDLKQFPFIMREEGSATRMTMEKALRQKLDRDELNTVAFLGSTTAVIQGIKSGVGCSILSRRAVQEDLLQGTLQEIATKDITISRDFFLVLRKGKAISPLCETLLAFLLETASVAS